MESQWIDSRVEQILYKKPCNRFPQIFFGFPADFSENVSEQKPSENQQTKFFSVAHPSGFQPGFSGAICPFGTGIFLEKITIFLVSESDKNLAVNHQGRCRTVCPIWQNSSGLGQGIENGEMSGCDSCGFQRALEI